MPDSTGAGPIADAPRTLGERRALLRDTAAGPAHSADLCRQAPGGADEDDRTALAHTLPPSRLLRTEGPSPRALAALCGLGKPKQVATRCATCPTTVRDGLPPLGTCAVECWSGGRSRW